MSAREQTDQGERRRETGALAVGVGLVVAGVLPGFLLASLAPRIRLDFTFGAFELGVTVALFYAVSMVASSPVGRLVDRLGTVAGIRLAAGCIVFTCLGVIGFAHSAASLAALVVVGGIGNAIAGPVVSALLRREIAAGRHGLAFGAQQAGAPLGAMLAGLALPAIAIPLGWRWAYAVTAVVAVAAAALAPSHPGARAPSPDAGGRRRLSSVHALALTAVFASAAGVGFISFLVSYSVENGIGEATAGLLLTAVSAAAVGSRLVLGAFADRRGGEALGPVAAMLVASVAGYLLLIGGEPAPIAVGALIVGAVGWGWPGALTLAVVERSPGAPAWAVGVMMSGLFAGAVAGPLLVGQFAEHGNFTEAWLSCAALALAAAATAALTRRAPRRSGAAPAARHG
jgi:MFS family permease